MCHVNFRIHGAMQKMQATVLFHAGGITGTGCGDSLSMEPQRPSTGIHITIIACTHSLPCLKFDSRCKHIHQSLHGQLSTFCITSCTCPSGWDTLVPVVASHCVLSHRVITMHANPILSHCSFGLHLIPCCLLVQDPLSVAQAAPSNTPASQPEGPASVSHLDPTLQVPIQTATPHQALLVLQ